MLRFSVVEDMNYSLMEDINKLHIMKDYPDIEMKEPVNKEEVLYEIKEKKLNIIFIPIMNGQKALIDSYKNLILECRQTFFVFVGENCSFSNARYAFTMGIFDYLHYPLQKSEVKECFNRAMEEYYSKFDDCLLTQKKDALIDHIFQGGDHVGEICRDILQTIYQDLDKDETEKQITIENLKERIYLELIYRKPWLEKFIWDQNFLYHQDFQLKRKDELQKTWESDFSDISRVIQKYQILDNKLIYDIGKYVIVHVDERLSLNDLSEHVFLNKSYISHIFKKVSGISLSEFIVGVKVDRAKILLMDKERKICEIAETIGYTDVEYFRKKFRDTTGVSPSEYRKQKNIIKVSA